MNRLTRLLSGAGAMAALGYLLYAPENCRRAVSAALELCAATVIPALFPFLAVSSLLIALGFGEWAAPHLAGLMTPLFRLPGCAASALILGFTGGYPVGARTAADLYRRGSLSRSEAERLLTFCNNANPAFLISILGAGCFHSVRVGFFLWLIHVLSALLTGLLLRPRSRAAERRTPPPKPQKLSSLPQAITESVQGALRSILSVCAFLVLFSVLLQPAAALPSLPRLLLTGFFELFSATPLLPEHRFAPVLAAAFAGWGGCCVHCQTAAALSDTDLRLSRYLQGKALQALLSGILAAAFLPIL